MRLKKLEELKRRVIERDRDLKEKAEESALVRANKEALLELTDLSIDEVSQIEKDIEEDFSNRRKKTGKIVLIFLAAVSVIVFFCLIIINQDANHDSASSRSMQATIMDVEAGTHHLGDNPGNEGTSFSKNFTITDVTQFRSAILEITFTTWGPNSAKPPVIIINSRTAGSVIENLPAPGSDNCWEGPVSDGSYDYNCEFTYKKEILAFLKSGSNSFKIMSGKKADDFLFRDIRISLSR